MTHRAVIFDCDGALIDSEWASARAWSAALRRAGYGLGAEEFASFIGTTDRQMAASLAARLDTDPDKLLSMASEELRVLLTGGLRPFPDALRMLERLDGYHLAVASNSERWRLDAILASAGLGDRFGVSVASDEVSAPKPEPLILVRAADLMGVPPRACLVVEDSPTGVTAALRAGMDVVAVDRGYFPGDALSGATWLVDTLDDFESEPPYSR